jgi:FAD/FMN-containing dehydrogenase
MTPLRDDFLSWGRAHRYAHRALVPAFVDDAQGALAAAVASGTPVLPYGLGRSYGDSCLNEGGTLLVTSALDRFIAFDPARGEIECEAGVSLADILMLLTHRPADGPRWFLPVTPGTKWVTVGGAIANDVHGKSHHSTGTFGAHVQSMRLLRSDGSVRILSPSADGELFRATIGGLGLTGLILSARIALMRVPGFLLECEDIRYRDLDAFFRLSEESRSDWQYTVAWVDCLARGRDVGRGVFSRARHGPQGSHQAIPAQSRFTMPVDAPHFLLNRYSVRAFNALRWRRFSPRPVTVVRDFDPVLYPLDAIAGWNRLYGRRGFFQYQCVVPHDDSKLRVRELLERVAASGHSAFLAVLKVFGDIPSPGLLSFPMPGATLALDLPNRGRATLALMEQLDNVVRDAGGRLYPAKDARMRGEDFRRGFPRWQQFRQHVDPAFSSSFWRRVSATDA